MNMIYLYLAAINVIGLLSMFLDKHRARKHKRRIPEKTLFLIAVLGGSLGSIAGMYLFHHKTKHWYFVVGMPVIFFLQIAVFIFSCTLFTQ
ncbi:MAG: DUF1294 domain-containing protein [Lachnospiraceae bacterium]